MNQKILIKFYHNSPVNRKVFVGFTFLWKTAGKAIIYIIRMTTFIFDETFFRKEPIQRTVLKPRQINFFNWMRLEEKIFWRSRFTFIPGRGGDKHLPFVLMVFLWYTWVVHRNGDFNDVLRNLFRTFLFQLVILSFIHYLQNSVFRSINQKVLDRHWSLDLCG